MSLLDWAKREVEIACKKGEFDYGCACYESALKAFESLCDDGHSGFSIKVTQQILNRLIDGQPLTPIEDADDIWNPCHRVKEDGALVYQCKRMSSLFKYVHPDGSVEYYDDDHSYCIDINTNSTYHFGLVSRIINRMFPITMPYIPGKPIKVYCEDFWDTVGIFYALREVDGKQEHIDIHRFFRTSVKGESGFWTEITEEEYKQKQSMAKGVNAL